MRRTLQERFDAKYIPEPNSGCWLWIGGVSSGGYGIMWDGNRLEGAHRLSWSLNYGAIPRTLFVLHRCDTPACVNPQHLFLGTAADNVADCLKKGRGKKPTATHCEHGHFYSESNTGQRRNGGRYCKACKRQTSRISMRKYYRKRAMALRKTLFV